MDVSVYDFVGIFAWAALMIILHFVNKKRLHLARGDFIFVSVTFLFVCELLWLRIGYS